MDVPFAIQKYLQAQAVLTNVVEVDRIYLLELGANQTTGIVDETFSQGMPVQAVVVKASGGPVKYGENLPLNDLHVQIISYGQTMHLAYNIDSIVYQLLKALKPSVWAETYLHWAKPLTRPIPMRDPTLQWPYVASVWQTLASDLTIAA